MNQKAYALSDASLDTSTLEVKHALTPPGRSEILFIVPIAENRYFVTKLSWLVIPNPSPIVEDGTTFILQDGKFSPAIADITYAVQTGLLEGSLPDGTNIRLEKNEIITVNSRAGFDQITKLPGWEKAAYKE